MATKSKTVASAIGSTPWLDQENEQVAQFAAQEADDFAFSVRNELDFLNEHMAEVFSRNQVLLANYEGRLRVPPESETHWKPEKYFVRFRESKPLNDIFAPNTIIAISPSRGTNAPKEQRQFHATNDAALPKAEEKANASNNSGYHGQTEDDMDVAEEAPVAASEPLEEDKMTEPIHLETPRRRQSREQSAFDVSFHSAKEDLTREPSKEPVHSLVYQSMSPRLQAFIAVESAVDPSSAYAKQANPGDSETLDSGVVDREFLIDEDLGNDSLHSPSQGSSPAAKGLARKSSLTFATLPAREPLTTKKSIGSRLSRTSIVGVSKGVVAPGSFLGRIAGGKSLGGVRQPETAAVIDSNDGIDIDENEKPQTGHGEFNSGIKERQLHNMSSTQRLHEKINKLGQPQAARPTKSIPTAAISSHALYPELPLEQTSHTNVQRPPRENEDDDDWIQPPSTKAYQSPRPQLPKSISADVMENLRGKVNISDEDFGKEQRHPPRRRSLESDRASPNAASSTQAPSAIVASPPEAAKAEQAILSTTPVGTPVSTRPAEGPISASKSKLQSIMKTARGLFTSSAGASAQAKMELCNQAKIGSPNNTSPSKPTLAGKGVEQTKLILSTARPENLAKPAEGRRTRGSIEKEKKEKARQRNDLELEISREEEAQKHTVSEREERADERPVSDEHDEIPRRDPIPSSRSQPEPTRKSPRRLPDAQHSVLTVETGNDNAQDTVSGKVSKQPQQSQLQKPREIKRAVKPPKEVAPKPEPQRVAIRVGTLFPRIPLSNAALASGLQDSLPLAPNKQPGLSKKTSTASIQTSASNSGVRNTTASKPKALIAAEKKREQDEKEAQRKLEQKREVERKRAAQQEESRRQEQIQRREAEKQREQDRVATAEDPKKIAQRQAIEKRRQDLAKKDQQRAPPVSQQQIPPNTRPELSGARPPPKLHAAQDYSRPPGNHHGVPNPAKAPIKRALEADVEEPVRQSRLPGGQPYLPNDAKRRRTNDEEPEEPNVRLTKVPPKRQSNLKDTHRPYGPSLMGPPPSMINGYSHAKPPVTNHTYQSQHQHQAQSTRPGQAPQDMAKHANGRIVFAENTNPAYPGHKTPNQSRSINQPLAKSSPQYINGENIQLEDIPTDSDEDDSEDEHDKKAKGAMLPSWVQSPVLNELLREQERHKDPDSIFGPSAAVNMEEMFKERHHRFRSRTSSANWAGNDRLTEEEIRTDNAARERMRREGGWTYGL
ncbi:MAG: hypothetical protein Q9170_000305 [Blastenia crenularia]